MKFEEVLAALRKGQTATRFGTDHRTGEKSQYWVSMVDNDPDDPFRISTLKHKDAYWDILLIDILATDWIIEPIKVEI